jgi:hypothetical protein
MMAMHGRYVERKVIASVSGVIIQILFSELSYSPNSRNLTEHP